MKFRTDKDIIRFIGFTLSAILIGIIIFNYFQTISIFGFILILSGLIGFIIVIQVASKPKQELIEDERSIRVREKAGFYALLSLLYIVGIFELLRMLKLSPSLTPSPDYTGGAQHLWFAREKAASKAYFATLIALLFLMAFGNIIPEIKNANYWDVASFIFFVGLLPFLIYDWYYKKGEYNENN